MVDSASHLGLCGALVSARQIGKMLLKYTHNTLQAILLTSHRHTLLSPPLLVWVLPQSVLTKSNGAGTAAKAWA
jgi:hypothetical protein